jgi:hypothetical protein
MKHRTSACGGADAPASMSSQAAARADKDARVGTLSLAFDKRPGGATRSTPPPRDSLTSGTHARKQNDVPANRSGSTFRTARQTKGSESRVPRRGICPDQHRRRAGRGRRLLAKDQATFDEEPQWSLDSRDVAYVVDVNHKGLQVYVARVPSGRRAG